MGAALLARGSRVGAIGAVGADGAAGIHASFFGPSLTLVGGDRERTILGTANLLADDNAVALCALTSGAVVEAVRLDPFMLGLALCMETCASSTICRAARFFSSSTCPIAWFRCAIFKNWFPMLLTNPSVSLGLFPELLRPPPPGHWKGI